MLLIPVVVVIGGILGLVLYLEKRSPTLSRVGPQSKAPRSLPPTQGQRARPYLRGCAPGAPGSSLGCAPWQKVGW